MCIVQIILEFTYMPTIHSRITYVESHVIISSWHPLDLGIISVTRKAPFVLMIRTKSLLDMLFRFQ